jgi:hypothetical protein
MGGNTMRIWVGILLCSTPALSASANGGALPAETDRLAVIGFGSCDEPSLAEATRAMRAALEVHLGAKVLLEEATAEPAEGLERSSLEEVSRAIEAGKTEFLNLNMAKAEKTLRSVLPEIDKLPLGSQRWEAFCSARAYLARVYQFTEQRAKATELFLDIVKVQEEFQLSRIEFPPSARDLLEMTRSLLPGLPKFALKVVSPAPGAPVYVNGYPIGKTPFERRMAAGTYEVVVGEAAEHSFVRKLPLHSDTTLDIDAAQERRFRATEGPCYQGRERKERLSGAAMLGIRLSAGQVVAVQFEKLGGEEYLAAALVESAGGREVREGRIRTEKGILPPLGRLAEFVLTGEGEVDATGTLLEYPVVQESAPGEWAGLEPVAESEPAGALEQPQSTKPQSMSTVQGQPSSSSEQERLEAPLASSEDLLKASDEPESLSGRLDTHRASKPWHGTAAWALAGVALVLAGAAVAEHLHLQSLDRELNGLVIPGSGGAIDPADVPRMNDLKSDISSAKSWRTGLLIGAAGAGVGSGILFWASIGSTGRAEGGGGLSVSAAGSF